MYKEIKANNIAFKTFNHLKVNDTKLSLPEIEKSTYKLTSDKKVKIKEFENAKYAISEEIIELNNSLGNFYKYYNPKRGEEKTQRIDLLQDAQNKNLLDTYDIVLEEDSKQTLILNYQTADDIEKFRNTIIRILAKKNSELKLFIVQNADNKTLTLESIFANLEENSNVNICQYQLGSKKLFTNFQGDLKGENSNLNINSIYFGYGDNQLDILYNIFHHGIDTKSEVLVNGALKDNSYKSFKSTLDFKEGSSFSVGSEEEYAILMDDTVTNISVPVLLAHEDNVEGNHAASAGKIDSNLLFYIMSRGYSKEEAEALVVQSKFSGAIDKIEEENLKGMLWGKVVDIVRS